MREIKGEELGDISTYGINAKEERVIVVKGEWGRDKEGGVGKRSGVKWSRRGFCKGNLTTP